MRGCGGMDTVDDIGCNINSALEAKGHVSSPQVVVDGFWKADNVYSVLCKQIGCFVGAVSTQNNQRIQLVLFIGFQHFVQLGFTIIFFHRGAHCFKGLTGSSQDGSAQCQDSRKIGRGHFFQVTLDQTAITIANAIDFNIFSKAEIKRFGNTAQRRVQSLAVASACQHSYFHNITSCF